MICGVILYNRSVKQVSLRGEWEVNGHMINDKSANDWI
jgi:hypothetical protein